MSTSDLPEGLYPSHDHENVWVSARRGPDVGPYPKPTERGGKWMLFVPVEELDAMWQKIARAVEEGRLGYSAKCATAVPNPRAWNDREKVICVYTYDGNDEADRNRVREELRRLGVREQISWKADKATQAGRYGPGSAQYRA